MAPETQEREVRALAARHNDVLTGDAMLADRDISGRSKFADSVVDADLKRLDIQKPTDLRLWAAIDAKEHNDILRSLFERIDLDAATAREPFGQLPVS
jgi:hypothetical protein